MNIIDLPSPNFDSRAGASVEMLVLHYTGMRTGEEALARLVDPAAKVSAHYVVEEDGRIFHLVAEEDRAWHAGVSCWRGNRFVNAASVGIEIVNPGHEFGYRPFPEAQMQAVIELCRGILSRHPIPARNVVGHSDVAPTRKEDPGELFDWARLAKEGIGLWPYVSLPEKSPEAAGILPRGQKAEPALSQRSGGPWDFQEKIPGQNKGDSGPAILFMQSGLHAYGYEIHPDGHFGEQTAACVRAFQRHFRPRLIDGLWDAECGVFLSNLLNIID